MLPLLRIFKIFTREIRRKPHLNFIFILLSTTIFIGTFGFSFFEGRSLWDSFYWTIVVITTVGFGDIYPVTFWGRIIFFIVALLGISTITIAVGEFASYLVEGKIMEMRGLKKVERKSHVVIIGWNRNTESTYAELKNRGIECIVVDDKIDPVKMREKKIPFVSGDPTKMEILEKAGVRKARAVLISYGNDEKRTIIALKARRLNKRIKIVSICDSPENADAMRDAGVDVVIPIGDIEGILLANAIEEEPVVDFVVDILEAKRGLDVNHYIVEKDMNVQQLRKKVDGKPIAIYRKNEEIIDFDDDFPLRKGDVVIILTKAK